MRTLLVVLALVALVAFAFALAWPVILPWLTYVPERLTAETGRPARYGLTTASEVWLETEDEIRLHGWWVPADSDGHPPCDAVAIYFHGNAGSIAGRAGIAGALALRGLDVLLFDYRGYGRSEGRPTGPGLVADAEAAWRFVVEERGVPPDRVVLIGNSLGSAVAAALALDRDGGGLVLGAPFPGAPAVAARHAPWLPVRLLRWTDSRYDEAGRLDRLRMPLLVLIGERDTLIPPDLSERVFERAPEPKRRVRIDADHNTLIGHPAAWAAIDRFLAEHLECSS